MPFLHSRYTDEPRPRARPGSWLVGSFLITVGVLAIRGLAANDNMRWEVVGGYFFSPRVLQGLAMTLLLTVIAMTIGIVLGAVLAVMRLSGNLLLVTVSAGYVGLFRGIPMLIQVMLWYNAALVVPRATLTLPGGETIGIETNAIMTPMLAAILGLGLNQAAYTSEVIRAGLISVPFEQTQAGLASGMTGSHVFFRVVLPQAIRVIIPPVGNELIGMLKATSIVSVVAMHELLYTVQLIYARTGEVVPLLLVASIWYLITTTILAFGQRALERHVGRSQARSRRVRVAQVEEA